MANETWEQLIARLFPDEIDGAKRPSEPIPADLPFNTNFKQFIANDENWFEHENAFLRQLLSNDFVLHKLLGVVQNALTQEDFKIVTTAMKGLMSPDMLKKLNSIANNANNYSHPTTAGNRHIPAGGKAGMILKWLSDGTAQWVNEYSYSHPTTAGNKHIPAGGSSGKILRWSADGTAAWGDDVNTWRGCVNNLTSTATDQSLSAAMGKKLQDEKAAKASPEFTGTPTAPTPANTDSSKRLATTEFVKAVIAGLTGQLRVTSCLIAQNGYIALGWTNANGTPGSLILQWGRATKNVRDENIVFPIIFPVSCYVVMTSVIDDNFEHSATTIKYTTLTTSGFTLCNNGSQWPAVTPMWLALGK